MIPPHIRTVEPDPVDDWDIEPGTCGVCFNELGDCFCLEDAEDFDTLIDSDD